MITVITRKEIPTKVTTCSNCGSELKYTNGDLYEETNCSINYDYLRNHYFYCPVCGCKQYANWIINNEKEDKV